VTVPLRYMLKRRAVRFGDRGSRWARPAMGPRSAAPWGPASSFCRSSWRPASRRGGGRHRCGDLDRDRYRAGERVRRGRRRHGAVLAFALLIGLIAFPGAFLAKAFVERMPVHVHTAILDAVVLIGGAFLVIGAFAR